MAAAAMTLRRHREDASRLALARRNGWEYAARPSDQLVARLRALAIMQIGHSRVMPESFRMKDRTSVSPYVFETGFDERRRTHHWLVASSEVLHACSRAAITHYDWLLATAACPACRLLRLDGASPTPARASDVAESLRSNALTAIVFDEEEWRRRLVGDLAGWLLDQPPTRCWEILPGLVVGYEPGRPDEKAIVELEAATRALARLLPG